MFPLVGCSVDGYRGCNKFGQVCNFCRMDGAQVDASNMIHPLPPYRNASMIMWPKLTALIGLMGKLRLPSSLTLYLSLIWFLGHATNSPSLHRMTQHCQKSPNLSCPPHKFGLLFEHIDSSTRFITSCMSHPIPSRGRLSHSRIFAGLFKSKSHAEGYKGALPLSLGPLK